MDNLELRKLVDYSFQQIVQLLTEVEGVVTVYENNRFRASLSSASYIEPLTVERLNDLLKEKHLLPVLEMVLDQISIFPVSSESLESVEGIMRKVFIASNILRDYFNSNVLLERVSYLRLLVSSSLCIRSNNPELEALFLFLAGTVRDFLVEVLMAKSSVKYKEFKNFEEGHSYKIYDSSGRITKMLVKSRKEKWVKVLVEGKEYESRAYKVSQPYCESIHLGDYFPVFSYDEVES